MISFIQEDSPLFFLYIIWYSLNIFLEFYLWKFF